MNKNSYGAQRKRTNTPAMNRKRAVESRHFRTPVNNRKSVIRKIEPAVCEAAEEITTEIAQQTETEVQDQVFFSAETESKTNEQAAQPAAGNQDLLTKITSVFKGLFKKNKQQPAEPAADPLDMASEAAQPVGIGGVVSSVATWMTSPIDPDSEETATERTAEETQEENGEVPQYEENETDQTDQTEESQKTEAGEDDIQDDAEETGEDLTGESGGTPEDINTAETEEETSQETGDGITEEPEDVSEEELEEVLPEEEPAEENQEETEAEPAPQKDAVEAGEEAEIGEEFSAEEIPVSDTESDESQQQTELIDIPEGEQEAAEEENRELTRKEKRAERKAIRKETKLQLIDEIVDKPRAGLLLMAILPGYAMKKVASVEKTTLSAPSVLILNVIKWAAIGTFFAMFIESFVNLFEYSFVRMIFSDVAALAFKFGGFGLLLEYGCYIIIGLFCGLIRKRISTLKLMCVEARSSLFVALIFIIADLLIWKGMLVYAVIAAVIGTVCGLMLKGYGMDLVLPVSKGTQIILAAILVGIAVWLTFPFVKFATSGLTDIFKAILNL